MPSFLVWLSKAQLQCRVHMLAVVGPRLVLDEAATAHAQLRHDGVDRARRRIRALRQHCARLQVRQPSLLPSRRRLEAQLEVNRRRLREGQVNCAPA